MKCDSCGVPVDSKGFLGGEIVCFECARLQREGEHEQLEDRRERFGGGSNE